MIHLVRHAHAGTRQKWTGDDRLRPISGRGRAEAEWIRQNLGARDGLTGILSSPLHRCIQTMEPIAARLGFEIATADWLAEKAAVGEVERHIIRLDPGTILCSHGDVIGALIEHLAAADCTIEGPMEWPKSSIWHLGVRKDRITSARYEAAADIKQLPVG